MKVDPCKKNMTHPKVLDPHKNFWSMKKHIWPRNARKNYDPRKMLNHVKNIFTNITYAKIWPTQPTHPRNPGSHVTHVTTQPTQITKVF